MPGITRAQAFQWLAWMNVTLGGAVYRHVQNTSDQIPEDLRNAKVAALGKAEVHKLLGILEQHLIGKTWMVGDTFTLVDAHLVGAIVWINHLGFDTKSLTSIDAWTARCKARPAFARTMA